MNRPMTIFAASILFLISSIQPSSANWNFESTNNSKGIVATAQTFWAQGFGPVSRDRLLNLNMKDEDYWAALDVYCSKRQLYVSIYLFQAGSGHEEFQLDDPGYYNLVFNGQSKKRFRTWGSGDTYRIAFSTDARRVTQELMRSRTMSLVVRDRYWKRGLTLNFQTSGFSKAKTRFKYAGCPL